MNEIHWSNRKTFLVLLTLSFFVLVIAAFVVVYYANAAPNAAGEQQGATVYITGKTLTALRAGQNLSCSVISSKRKLGQYKVVLSCTESVAPPPYPSPSPTSYPSP